MKPKFFMGSGRPPLYLLAILGNRKLVFSGGKYFSERSFELISEQALLEALQIVADERVPLSIGGHDLGAADEVELLIARGDLHGPYIQIAWSDRGNWTIREMVEGATEWEETTDLQTIANKQFQLSSHPRLARLVRT